MYAVIFKAEVAQFDAEYTHMAAKMRQLAMDEFGCKEFIANTEGDSEIAISYWDNLDNIKAWKNNIEHRQAQAKGQSTWYKSYTVQIVEILREYSR
ncbi:antibiotic biosynthesis monooxygenase family protein [Algibacillus agarilyticus]|uniref:antibiotic biosynthesis monooxygenase family protein n=1 Tax=Algibacillus agarilyticus TaxID=2234133 RepID=UPI000DD0DEA7|nr:antibiotic biosynthesis monooxygenase [Algibacillus agarilyticus]